MKQLNIVLDWITFPFWAMVALVFLALGVLAKVFGFVENEI